VAGIDGAFPWYAAAPSELRRERATLSLKLLPAVRHFTELVVPGLGRTWFVRQLSWSVSGLKLAREARDGTARAPTLCALAIEALACKRAWTAGVAMDRIIGSRAFQRDDRDPNSWTFDALTRREHYVLNSYRAGTVRALMSDPPGAGRVPGLGFAKGRRFSSMALTPVGDELAAAFLDQRAGQPTLRAHLVRWIDGGRLPDRSSLLLKALRPDGATPKERSLVAERLLRVESESARKRLSAARVLIKLQDAADLHAVAAGLRKSRHDEQAKEVELAESFGEMLECAQRVIAALTRSLGTRPNMTASELVRRAPVQMALRALSAASRDYRRRHERAPGKGHVSAKQFAAAVEGNGGAEVLELLVRRDGQVLRLSDAGAIQPGPLYRSMFDPAEADDDALDPDSRGGGRTFGVANLHSMVHDIGGRFAE
jgi:hypothetical protein